MAEVDASITANIGANSMANLGRLAETMNAINQNRLFMGRRAAGAALQQSIDPNTGQVDFAKVNRLISSDPKIAPYAQQALTEALSAQGQNITNTTAQANLASVYSANLRQDLAATTDPTSAASVVARGVAAGRYPQSFAASFLGGQNTGGLSLSDWRELQKESAVASGSGTAMEAQFGEPATVDTGPKNVAVTTNRVTGERNTLGGDAGEIDKALTPEAKASRVGIIGPGNVPQSVPQSALVTDTGEPKVSAITGAHGEVQTGLAPGIEAAASTAGQQNAALATQLTVRASKVRDNKAILGNMEGLLDHFEPGPQSQFWKGLGQLGAEYGIKIPGTPPKDKVAAQEEFGKLAFQLAQSQFQALGGTGTDSKLDSTMHTSPSELMSRYGNKGIIGLLKGNEDAILAQQDAWQKWQDAGHGPDTYGKFLSQWNKVYDPRVFQSEYMDPKARQTMLNGMSGDEKKQFERSYKTAVAAGWIK